MLLSFVIRRLFLPTIIASPLIRVKMFFLGFSQKAKEASCFAGESDCLLRFDLSAIKDLDTFSKMSIDLH